MSLSRTRSQWSQSKTRVPRGSLAFTAPQAEHVFDDGENRSTATSCVSRSEHSVAMISSSWLRPASARERDRHLLDRCFAVFDESEQASCRIDRMQPDELLHLPPNARVLRLQQRLREHQTNTVA